MRWAGEYSDDPQLDDRLFSIMGSADERGWYVAMSRDREDLLAAVDAWLMHLYGAAQPLEGAYLTVLRYSCGGRAEFQQRVDVPYYSVPCSCGAGDHWLIWYWGNASRN